MRKAGTTCQVSAHSGLPALGVASGFSDDGVPVGMDLLGRRLPSRLCCRSAMRSSRRSKLRRPPFSTPRSLAAGRRRHDGTTLPSGGARRRPAFDDTTCRIAATRSKLGAAVASRSSRAIWIHAGSPDKPAAARHRLFARGRPQAGRVTLSAQDRRELAERRLDRALLPEREGGAARQTSVRLHWCAGKRP